MSSLNSATCGENKYQSIACGKAAGWQTVLLFTFLMATSPAQSATVYSQASDSPDTAHPVNSSQTNPDGSDQDTTTFDNFTLNHAAQITGVTWRGNSTDAGSAGFNITIYGSQNNNASLADLTNPLSVFTELGKANEKLLGKHLSDFRAEFTQPVSLSAAKQYWISIVSLRSYPSPWGWSSASGGDGRCIQSFSEFKILPAQYDRAFSLLDGNVEPTK